MIRTQPTIAQPAGCWSNFVSGTSKTVNWCGRQISTAATAVWSGMQKAATWAANFFKRAAFHIGVATAAAISFVKAHSREFIVGGVALASGLLLGLLFNRLCGCCNKPKAKAISSDELAELNRLANTEQARNTVLRRDPNAREAPELHQGPRVVNNQDDQAL